MPKLTLSIDIGASKQKFDLSPEFVEAAQQFIGTQTSFDAEGKPQPKYPDVHALIVSHVEALADNLLDQFPQRAAATAKSALDAAEVTIRAEKEKYRKATKV